MKTRIVVLVLVAMGALLPNLLLPQGSSGGPSSANFLTSPASLDRFRMRRAGLMSFLASEQGRRILHMSSHPVARGLLKLFGEGVNETSPFGMNPRLFATRRGLLSAGLSGSCAQPSGSPFNLQPRTGDPAVFFDGGAFPMPQNEESIDFLMNRVGGNADLIVGVANDVRGLFGGLEGSYTGFYVHRAGRDCGADFEGGLPSITDVNGITLFGRGDPVVAADPMRDAFFAGDLHFGFDPGFTRADGAVGVFRTTAAALTNITLCPPGTHDYNDTACWPTRNAVNLKSLDLTTSTGFSVDKPHLAVDERATGSGTGAGDVYVADTLIDDNNGNTSIELVACTNSLSACSSSITISGTDGTHGNGFTQFPHVSVRPDGKVTITYVFFDFTNIITRACFNSPFPPCQTNDLRWVICAPAGAPNPPACSPPALILTDTHPIGTFGLPLIAGESFRVPNYPKHDHQVEPDGTIQSIVVWDRCKVPLAGLVLVCPASEVAMVASNNDGATWSAIKPVNTHVGSQFFSWIKTDRGTNTVNIVYYSSENDVFQHRAQVFLNQIHPGIEVPNPIGDTHVLTTIADDPSVDPFFAGSFFGDYIGVAARGTTITGQRRAYVHYTYNTNAGIIGGLSIPEENNQLTRFDY